MSISLWNCIVRLVKLTEESRTKYELLVGTGQIPEAVSLDAEELAVALRGFLC